MRFQDAEHRRTAGFCPHIRRGLWEHDYGMGVAQVTQLPRLQISCGMMWALESNINNQCLDA
jgi:hypothetical protein